MIGLLTGVPARRVGVDLEFPSMEHFLRNVFKRANDKNSFFDYEDFSNANVEVQEKDIVVTMAVPGRKPEAIELEVVGNCLTVKVGKCSCCEHKENSRHYFSRERNCEEFEYSLRLPMAVQGAKAVAKVVDGVLTVIIPRFDADVPKSHVIKVN